MPNVKIRKTQGANLGLILACVFAVGAFVFGAFFINSSSEKSSEYTKLLVKRDALITQNQILKNQIAKYSSLSNIQKKATDYGMVSLFTR